MNEISQRNAANVPRKTTESAATAETAQVRAPYWQRMRISHRKRITAPRLRALLKRHDVTVEMFFEAFACKVNEWVRLNSHWTERQVNELIEENAEPWRALL